MYNSTYFASAVSFQVIYFLYCSGFLYSKTVIQSNLICLMVNSTYFIWLTTGVTAQQGTLTPRRHLIPPLVFPRGGGGLVFPALYIYIFWVYIGTAKSAKEKTKGNVINRNFDVFVVGYRNYFTRETGFVLIRIWKHSVSLVK